MFSVQGRKYEGSYVIVQERMNGPDGTSRQKTRITFLCAVFLACGGVGGMAQELTAAVGEWPPYTGSELQHNGMAAEIVRAAAAAAGLEVELVFLPWRRAESMVAAGEFFATFPYQFTREREENLIFSDILFTSNFIVACRKEALIVGDHRYSSPDGFRGLRVGVISGTDAVYLPLAESGARVVEVQDPRQLVKMLQLGRLDFVIDDERVFLLALYLEKASDIGILGEPFGKPAEFRLMASRLYPDSQAILDRFNFGIAEIQAAGTLTDIINRYRETAGRQKP